MELPDGQKMFMIGLAV